MRVLKMCALSLALTLTVTSAVASPAGDRILGTYKAFGQDTDVWSEVLFTKTAEDQYEGRVTWVEDKGLYDAEGNVMLDTRNADPELRNVRVDQILVVWGISYDAKKNVWKGGKIYNPVDGKTYDVQISFENPDQIKLRGYVGAPMFGRSFYWNKTE